MIWILGIGGFLFTMLIVLGLARAAASGDATMDRLEHERAQKREGEPQQ
jgi:hypothetical protein